MRRDPRRVPILLAAALLAIAPAFAADSTETDPLYWHAFYRPRAPHRIRVLVAQGQDKRTALDWIRSHHPNVEFRTYSSDLYDFAVPRAEYNDIADHLTASLNLSSDEWEEIWAAQIYGPVPGESCQQAVTLIAGSRHPKSTITCRVIDQSKLKTMGARLGDPAEIPEKRRALARDGLVLGPRLKSLPGVASLLESQRATLDWSERIVTFFSETVTIRVIFDYNGSYVTGSQVAPQVFAAAWNLMPGFIGRTNVDPCRLTPSFLLLASVPERSAAMNLTQDRLARAGARFDLDQECRLPPNSQYVSVQALLPCPAADRLRMESEDISPRNNWRTFPSGEAELTLLELRDSLEKEARSLRSPSNETPSIAALVSSELERLAPLAARRAKIGNLCELDFRFSSIQPMSQ
jgi:hypothetical protein